MNNLTQLAINLALNGNWNEAIETNLKLLAIDAKDTDALNRLAKAYAESGHISKAKLTTQKVLKLNPFDAIATKSLSKWKLVAKNGQIKASHLSGHEDFLEEPGKTKIVSLLNLGDKKLIAKLNCGDRVLLSTNSHRVTVIDQDKKLIGRFADDFSLKLKRLIKLGYSYETVIKSADFEGVKVFIKEVGRAKGYQEVQSFPIEKIDYLASTYQSEN